MNQSLVPTVCLNPKVWGVLSTQHSFKWRYPTLKAEEQPAEGAGEMELCEWSFLSFQQGRV